MSDTIVSILFYISIAATLGFMIGWLCGEQVARRKNAEAMVQELGERLEEASSETSQDRQLSQMRRVLNDAHRHILAVSKGLKNQPR
jgi:hypothetical protein